MHRRKFEKIKHKEFFLSRKKKSLNGFVYFLLGFIFIIFFQHMCMCVRGFKTYYSGSYYI